MADLTSSLLGMLTQQLSGPALGQLAGQLGTDPQQTQKAVSAALPMLLGALGRNAAKPEGAAALLGALQRNHDGSVLNDVAGHFAQGSATADGNKILRHVLGDGQDRVQTGISAASGLEAGATGNLMAMLAPLVMGALGQQTRSQGLDVGGLAQLLMGEKQQADSALGSMGGLEGLLDMNHDGSIMDDIVSIGSKLLGGLFKR